METRYVLDAQSQVRKEDFGLLFYTMKGPRLYFLPSGKALDTPFFQGKETLKNWLELHEKNGFPENKKQSLKKALQRLKEKGVIHEC